MLPNLRVARTIIDMPRLMWNGPDRDHDFEPCSVILVHETMMFGESYLPEMRKPDIYQ